MMHETLRRAACGFACALSLLSGATAAAIAEPEACLDTPVTAAADFAALHALIDEVARRIPTAGIATACSLVAAARNDNERAQALVDLGRVLTSADRDAEALVVLDAVIAGWRGSTTAPPRLVAESYLRRGQARVAQRRMSEAGDDFAAATTSLTAAKDLDHRDYAEVLLGRSAALRVRQDPGGAQRAANEGEALLRRLGLDRSREAADAMGAQAAVAFARGDLEAASRLARLRADLLVSIGGNDDRDLVDALGAVGVIRSVAGDYAGAESAMREGMRIAAMNPDAPILARLDLLQSLAALQLDRAQPDAALPIARRALEEAVAHYGSDSAAALRERLLVAQVETERVRDSGARRILAEAIDSDTRQGEATPLADRLRLRLAKAQNDMRMGDAETARDELVIVAGLLGDRTGLEAWRGWNARLSCRLAARRSSWEEAERLCASAATFYGAALTAAINPLVFEALVGRCDAQARGRLPGTACDEVAAWLQRGTIVDRRLRVVALQARAEAASARGQREAATEGRIQALAAAESIGTPDPLWSAEYALAADLVARGDRRAGLYFGRRSLASIARLRERLDVDRDRLERGFSSDKLDVFRHVAAWLLDEGVIPEALEIMERLKREEYYDFAERDKAVEGAAARPVVRRTSSSGEGPMALTRADGPLGVELTLGTNDAVEMERLSRLAAAGRITREETARLEQLQRDALADETRRIAVIRRLIAEDPVIPQASNARTEAVAALSNAVGGGHGDGPVDVHLLFLDTQLSFIFVTPSGMRSTSVPVDAAAVNRALRGLLAALDKRQDLMANADAAALYGWLGAPIDRELRANGTRRIRLWLDGALRYVPFNALWDGQAFLIERYEITVVAALPRQSGVATAAAAQPAVASTSNGMVAFGVSQAVGGFPALRGVADELCGIVNGPVSGLIGDGGSCAPEGQAHGALEGRAFANAFFTESRLRGFAIRPPATPGSTGPTGRPEYLHIGTHYTMRAGNARRSSLLLGDGNQLTLAALDGIDLTGVGVVTVSACESGRGGSGGEVEDFPMMLHRLGAKAVVTSLWKIDDQATAALMRDFYAGLKRPGSRVSEALRDAQLRMLRDRSVPRSSAYFWAAFVVSSLQSS